MSHTVKSNAARAARKFLNNVAAQPGVDFRLFQDADGNWDFETISRDDAVDNLARAGVSGPADAALPASTRDDVEQVTVLPAEPKADGLEIPAFLKRTMAAHAETAKEAPGKAPRHIRKDAPAKAEEPVQEAPAVEKPAPKPAKPAKPGSKIEQVMAQLLDGGISYAEIKELTGWASPSSVFVAARKMGLTIHSSKDGKSMRLWAEGHPLRLRYADKPADAPAAPEPAKTTPGLARLRAKGEAAEKARKGMLVEQAAAMEHARKHPSIRIVK